MPRSQEELQLISLNYVLRLDTLLADEIDTTITFVFDIFAYDNLDTVMASGGSRELFEDIHPYQQGLDVSGIFFIPEQFELYQNFPNPFNPVTTIRYDLPARANVFIVIYDILGRRVRTIIHGLEGPGYQAIQWDGTDDFGRDVIRVFISIRSKSKILTCQLPMEGRLVESGQVILYKPGRCSCYNKICTLFLLCLYM